jgi:prepilin signal peptidase PulO-like enzyme (type II secretory pathway)
MVRIKYLVLGSFSTLLIGSFIKYYLYRKRKGVRKNYPKNVVILHQFPDGLHAPSLSPYCLKLETWFDSDKFYD